MYFWQKEGLEALYFNEKMQQSADANHVRHFFSACESSRNLPNPKMRVTQSCDSASRKFPIARVEQKKCYTEAKSASRSASRIRQFLDLVSCMNFQMLKKNGGHGSHQHFAAPLH